MSSKSRKKPMLDKIVLWLIKRLVLLWDRHDDKLAFSFGKDEHTDYSVLVERFYDDHCTIGTAIYPVNKPPKEGRK